MKISARNLCWSAGSLEIVRNVTFDVSPGEFFGIIGPNGSGKSTLLSMLAGIRRPLSGEILLGDTPLRSVNRRQIARQMAFVEQQAETTERLTARQAVELGRTPYLGPLDGWSQHDRSIVDDALENVDMADKADRHWHHLSGGERQRLHIGRALAQQPQVLLLDEPTNHLDIGHQISLLNLVRGQGLTVIAALHDLNHAAMFCDRIAIMDRGALTAIGRPEEVLTPETINSVFGVAATVSADADGVCHVRFRPAHGLKKDFLEG